MNELREQIRNLLALQEIDTHVAVLRQERDEAPRRVAELERKVAETVAAFQRAEAEQEELLPRRQELERKLEDSERRLKRSQSKILEVKNPRQHKAVLKEMEDLKALREDWERELLTVMEVLEEVEARIEAAGRSMESFSESLNQEKEALEAMMGRVEEDLKRLVRNRQEYLDNLPVEVLAQYDFIRSRLRDAVVTPVREGTCLACHIKLPPQQFLELRRMDKLMTCPHCHRIIYAMDNDAG